MCLYIFILFQSESWDFQHYDACENDEVRSGILLIADYGTTITLYDSPGGDKGDDYTVIKVRRVKVQWYGQVQTTLLLKLSDHT